MSASSRIQLLGTRPHYYRGQLLLEDDFIGEQHYHAQARQRHTLHLHGWGVAWGLEVTAAGETAVSVGPGFAVDSAGHEIELREAAIVDLAVRGRRGPDPGAVVRGRAGHA